MPPTGNMVDGTYTLTAQLFVPDSSVNPSDSDIELDIEVKLNGPTHEPVIIIVEEV